MSFISLLKDLGQAAAHQLKMDDFTLSKELHSKINSQLNADTIIDVGRIIDNVSANHLYVVYFDRSIMYGVDIAASCSFSRHGSKPIGMYAVGSFVLCAYSPSMSDTVYIIGGMPCRPEGYECLVQNQTKPWDNTHLANDKIWNEQANVCHSVCYNASRPVDVIPGVDAGYDNELGVGFGMSKLFSWIRASETAGAWFFHLDNLVRIHSYNFDHWTAGGEKELRDDEGEVIEYQWSTPYSWEAKGMAEPKTDFTKTNEEGGRYEAGQTKPWLEPTVFKGGPRLVKFGGYLGDLEKEMVVVPKKGGPDIWGFRGVLDIQKHIDGLYTVRSAKGIIHEKYIFLPVPDRLNKPEEKEDTGDSSKNYRAGGHPKLGAGDEHNKEQFEWGDDGQGTAVNWALKIYDYHAHIFNHYGLVPVRKHKNDWFLPASENTAPVWGSFADRAVNREVLGENTYSLPLPPKFATLKVDHRPGMESVKYYCSRSIIAQLEDGSILIEDGYGSSIHMTGGNMVLSCPGDVWLRPGRSANVWAPDDINLKAGTSCDITASNKDVRIKAEHNLHMLAGNSGTTGGLVLECRSKDGPNVFDNPGEKTISYGINLVAKNSTCGVYANNVYISSKGRDGGIILDAGKGYGDLVTIANYSMMYSRRAMIHTLNYTPADESGCEGAIHNIFTKKTTFLANEKAFFVNSHKVAAFNADVLAVNGAGTATKGMAPFKNDRVKIVGDIAADVTARLSFMMCMGSDQINSAVYNSSRMGDSSLNIQFSCRDEEQYGLTDPKFIVPQARWQTFGGNKTWKEKVVVFNGQPTMPHPGYNNWMSKPIHAIMPDYKWFDGNKNKPESYDADGTTQNVTKVTLDGGYLITKQEQSS